MGAKRCKRGLPTAPPCVKGTPGCAVRHYVNGELETAIKAVAGVELNCPHCGQRSPIAESEVRRLVEEHGHRRS